MYKVQMTAVEFLYEITWLLGPYIVGPKQPILMYLGLFY